jgi:hypothetical protein
MERMARATLALSVRRAGLEAKATPREWKVAGEVMEAETPRTMVEEAVEEVQLAPAALGVRVVEIPENLESTAPFALEAAVEAERQTSTFRVETERREGKGRSLPTS